MMIGVTPAECKKYDFDANVSYVQFYDSITHKMRNGIGYQKAIIDLERKVEYSILDIGLKAKESGVLYAMYVGDDWLPYKAKCLPIIFIIPEEELDKNE